MLEPYVKKILAAHVYDVAVETPLQYARGISERLGRGYEVMLKREDLQPIFSFKLRGAYNKLSRTSAKDRARGVIASSAGNHAQGVALAARQLGVKAHIVMGRNTPEIKVKAVRRLGAEVILHGDSYDEAATGAKALAKAKNHVLIHPYNDADVIAGQGTVGMEIMNQHPGPDAVFVPVGGGGLIAGISAYVKYLRPATKVIGVEAEGSACLQAALAAGRRVRLPLHSLDRFADGVSVAQVGQMSFKIARVCVDEVVTVSTDEICGAIKDVFDDARSVAEPAGALAVAGLKKYVNSHRGERGKGRKLVAVVSGANVNFDRLRHIAERAEVGERREAVLGVTIAERHGSFRRFCRALGDHAVTEFNYRYARPGCGACLCGCAGGFGTRPPTGVEALAPSGLPSGRYDGQRGRQGACAAHGGRPRHPQQAGTSVPLRVSGAPRRPDAVPGRPRQPLEHQHVPLPQPRLRLGPRTGRLRGRNQRARQALHLPEPHRLPLLGGNGQSSLRAVFALSKVRGRGRRGYAPHSDPNWRIPLPHSAGEPQKNLQRKFFASVSGCVAAEPL